MLEIDSNIREILSYSSSSKIPRNIEIFKILNFETKENIEKTILKLDTIFNKKDVAIKTLKAYIVQEQQHNKKHNIVKKLSLFVDLEVKNEFKKFKSFRVDSQLHELVKDFVNTRNKEKKRNLEDKITLETFVTKAIKSYIKAIKKKENKNAKII